MKPSTAQAFEKVRERLSKLNPEQRKKAAAFALMKIRAKKAQDSKATSKQT